MTQELPPKNNPPLIVSWVVWIVKAYWWVVSNFFRVFFEVLTFIILLPVLLTVGVVLGKAFKIFGEERVLSVMQRFAVGMGIIFAILLLGSISGTSGHDFGYDSFGFRR